MSELVGAATTVRRTRHRGLERLATVTAVVFIAVYCVGRYRDAVLSFFFLDDFWLLRDVSALHWSSPLDLAQIFRPTHVGFQLYRPLTQTGYFALLWSVFGCDASGYHAVQLLAFACNALLVFGIARRLSGSVQAGLGASLIYATAPGHAVSAFWIAAFTMTGTALVVLLMLWAWLRIDSPRRRVAFCTVLQIIGVLASEHAVVGPILLALIAWGARPAEPWRQRLRLLTAPTAVVVLYGLFKFLAAAHTPLGGYAMSMNPVLWLMAAGQYALGSVSWFRMIRGAQLGRVSLIVGSMLVGVGVAAAWQARRSDGGWRLLAIGTGVFLVALLPVLPLTAHFYDYFIGIAALGPALAAVGACQLAGRRTGPWLALALGAGLVLSDVATGQRTARYDPIFGLVDGGARTSASWIAAVAAATQPDIREAAVPRNSVTESVFAIGHAERVFPGMPAMVSVIPTERQPFQLPGRAIVTTAALPRPDEFPALPCWEDRWAWIRALARWHLGARSTRDEAANAPPVD